MGVVKPTTDKDRLATLEKKVDALELDNEMIRTQITVMYQTVGTLVAKDLAGDN